MKLKEIKTEEQNLLDTISFFDRVPDTKPYYNEFIYLYGNRTLLSYIEELYLTDGINGVGMLFDLKKGEWEKLENISSVINENVLTDKKVVTTKENTGNVNKTGTRNQENNTDDYVVPYDEEVETKQSNNINTDSYNDTEDVSTDDRGKTEVLYTGYDKDKLDYLTNLFKNYPDYRYKVYQDIVNMLCLQIY